MMLICIFTRLYKPKNSQMISKSRLIEKNMKYSKDIKVLIKRVTANIIKYYKHLNTIIKITSCSNCIDYQVGCFGIFVLRFTAKKISAPLLQVKFEVKNTYLEEKKKHKGNVSQLPAESCYLGKLTVSGVQTSRSS